MRARGFAQQPLNLAAGPAPDTDERVGRAVFSALGSDEHPAPRAFQIPRCGGTARFPGVSKQDIEVEFALVAGGCSSSSGSKSGGGASGGTLTYGETFLLLIHGY